MISGNATAINMTKFPKEEFVEEGSEAEYVCETNYACCTDPPAVLWFVGDESVNSNEEHNIHSKSSSSNNGQMTKSTLRLTTNRTFNKRQVKCVLGNDDTKLKEHNLNVKCEYLLMHIRQRLNVKVSLLFFKKNNKQRFWLHISAVVQ